jgi:hypothetical protein
MNGFSATYSVDHPNSKLSNSILKPIKKYGKLSENYELVLQRLKRNIFLTSLKDSSLGNISTKLLKWETKLLPS